MTDEATEYNFLKADGVPNLADDPRLSLFAVCVASQQSAGFKTTIDARQFECPICKAAGFNTGWGYTMYTCGSEVLSDGEISVSCKEPT